jgi:hypothetical protein
MKINPKIAFKLKYKYLNIILFRRRMVNIYACNRDWENLHKN